MVDMPIKAHSLGGSLPLCRDAVGVFYSPSRLGKVESGLNYMHYLLSKYRTILNSKCSDLWLKLINWQPVGHDLLSAH